MIWSPGPPPDGSFGLYLVVLDPRAVRSRFATTGQEYVGNPIAVEWWGSKGKDTLRQTRIDSDLVTQHVAIEGKK